VYAGAAEIVTRILKKRINSILSDLDLELLTSLSATDLLSRAEIIMTSPVTKNRKAAKPRYPLVAPTTSRQPVPPDSAVRSIQTAILRIPFCSYRNLSGSEPTLKYWQDEKRQ